MYLHLDIEYVQSEGGGVGYLGEGTSDFLADLANGAVGVEVLADGAGGGNC